MSSFPLHVEIQNEGDFTLDEPLLVAAAQQVLNQHPQRAGQPSELTVVIVTDAEIADLNEQFRGVDAPTDVLSFPADAPPIRIEGEPHYWGDIVIAYPYAAEQAQREGHTLMDSLRLLVVHGTLHLLGYDHDSAEQRAAMWAAQADSLRALGIPLEIVPQLENSDHA